MNTVSGTDKCRVFWRLNICTPGPYSWKMRLFLYFYLCYVKYLLIDCDTQISPKLLQLQIFCQLIVQMNFHALDNFFCFVESQCIIGSSSIQFLVY